MKSYISLIVLCFIVAVFIIGCNAEQQQQIKDNVVPLVKEQVQDAIKSNT
jgi:hypothetical protein